MIRNLLLVPVITSIFLSIVLRIAMQSKNTSVSGVLTMMVSCVSAATLNEEVNVYQLLRDHTCDQLRCGTS